VSDVSAACGAASGCGGCRPLVSKIVQSELEAQNRHRLPTLQAVLLVGG
jgi:NAD(P)H-nitrite reductase large subunit